MRKAMFLLAAAIAAWTAAPLRSAPARQPAANARPSLVVVLVADQMRADYVLKYGHQWSGGLRRLVDRGAWFQQAMYPYAYTVTCVGHATISTGAFPNTHGIVGNAWWERASGEVGCADDKTARNVAYGGTPGAGAGYSAARLLTSTLSDNLRAQLPKPPRIVTFSMKERTAIMLAGHRADAVTWFDSGAGLFLTSSTYATAPVPFVKRFLERHPIEMDLKTPWTRSAAAGRYLFSDSPEGERAPSFWTTAFPHRLDAGDQPGITYAAWEDSPASDAYLARMAQAAVEDLQLGRGDGTDFLAVSFSALDLVGHDFGPQSHEVQDVLLRLDAALGRLLTYLDAAVGPDRYVVALTADHGVSPIPEQMTGVHVPAGRIDVSAIVSRIEETMKPALSEGGHAVAAAMGRNIYLTAEALAALATDPRLKTSLMAALQAMPGIARVMLTAERDTWPADDGLARATRLSYLPGRGPDLILQQQPYYLFGDDSGASHGTPYRYDTWVPLFFSGFGIRAGRYTGAVTPADLAPTLAWLCKITLPHADGRPLLEAVAQEGAPTGPGSGPGTRR